MALDPNDARLRLADATRRIIDQLASSSTDAAAFAVARDLVEQAAATLAERDSVRAYEGAAEGAVGDVTGFDLDAIYQYSPFLGQLNPLAPPIRVTFDGATARGDVTYPIAYEGPPGCVHGGCIAAGFDEVLGVMQATTGRPGMTARLQIDYKSPTPLFRPVRYEARIVRVEGRKIFTECTLSVPEEGRLCAQAEGLFISMRTDGFADMMRDRMNNARIPD